MIFVKRTFILTCVFSHHNKQNKFRKQVMKIRLLVWNKVCGFSDGYVFNTSQHTST